MTPLVVDPSGYLKPHHSVGHCRHIRHVEQVSRNGTWSSDARRHGHRLASSRLMGGLGHATHRSESVRQPRAPGSEPESSRHQGRSVGRGSSCSLLGLTAT